jgi:hypothetical protein
MRWRLGIARSQLFRIPRQLPSDGQVILSVATIWRRKKNAPTLAY